MLCFMSGPTLHIQATDSLEAPQRRAIRAMLDAAFRSFSDYDWEHACGGIHVWLELDHKPVSHASYVTRTLYLGDRAVRAGYVEAVATRKELQGLGYGSRVMRQTGEMLRGAYPLAALSTHRHRFYERFGWRRFRGPTSVAGPSGWERTPKDDGDVMVLWPARAKSVPLEAPLACDWRNGDVW